MMKKKNQEYEKYLAIEVLEAKSREPSVKRRDDPTGNQSDDENR
jgi:hypothetical protein